MLIICLSLKHVAVDIILPGGPSPEDNYHLHLHLHLLHHYQRIMPHISKKHWSKQMDFCHGAAARETAKDSAQHPLYSNEDISMWFQWRHRGQPISVSGLTSCGVLACAEK